MRSMEIAGLQQRHKPLARLSELDETPALRVFNLLKHQGIAKRVSFRASFCSDLLFRAE